ncbi:glycerophosphodiester phosphodiesterase [Agromyces ramosus]|uniref:Glycerophosphoryl diester phosphodiesterase n=1 Tax=Agromyces ramosus TaxID=33879 RepID=A0ABU0RCV7_9MICO|nr:glycerophosphodiester phosphodiesterase family protein [Agromyces ramosus]MDQ0895617.1 glycerophosphoryl diester phosphodiesterase [Agromyces ramosus]
MTRTSRAIDPPNAPQAFSECPPARRLLDHLAHPPRRAVRILLATLAVTTTASALLIAATPTTASAVDVFGALRVPGEAAFIVGHRGDRAEAPENTMPSLELAMDDLDFVETDVQMSRDGVPVLFHDTTLERVAGARSSIGDLDLEHLRRLDVGASYGAEYAGERIPTLDAFLEALADRETARALVELKADWTVEEVRTVVDLIERHALRGRVVLQSFSLETLFAIQRVSPTTPRIMLIRELPVDPVPLAGRLGVIGFGTTVASVTAVPDALEALHEAGVAVLCYTLNSHDHWQEVSALGVDGIITDQPSELDEWLAVTAPGT